jgi:hypothetical protein
LAEIVLRPRSGLEIIDAALSLLKREYVKFITIMGIGYLPYLIATLVFASAVEQESLAGTLGSIGGMIAAMFWLAVINAAMIMAASEAYLGREFDIAAILRQTASRFTTILGAGVLKVISVWIGILFLIVGAAWAWVAFFSVTAIVVIENRGAMEGMRRSAELTKGYRWTVFGTLCITYIIYFFLASIAGLPAIFLQSDMIVQVSSAVVTILVYPFVAMVETLLYYDLRIRKEGLDIELMTKELDELPAPQPLP